VTDYCKIAKNHPFHGPYHDKEYGFPISNESELFERLVMEIFQAGLSWLLILKKREAFRLVFDDFNIEKIVLYNQEDVVRISKNPKIIRNKKKIQATIFNAKRFIDLRDSHGGFAHWLNSIHPSNEEDWIALFRKTFRFTGPSVVREFLKSTGYLPGAHQRDCPVFEVINRLNPPWKKN